MAKNPCGKECEHEENKRPPHPCPYRSEIQRDDEPCECCEDCEKACLYET